MRKPRSFSAARVLLVGALVAGLVALIPLGPGGVSPAAAAPGDGTITVRVVQEVNANGLVDSTIMEPPLAGVTVHVSDGEGNSISSVTDDAGLAVFDLSATALVGGNYRVEADNPRPDFFYPSHAANGQSGPAAKITPANLQSPSNAKLSSTVEFVDVDDETDAYVNMAFWYPPYYCQENPTLCSAVQPWSATPPGGVSPPTEQTLISVPYRFNVGDQDLATNADTGVVYGIAYDRANQRIFSAAYAKRGSAYGPGGPGAIYVTDLSTTTFPLAGTTSQFATVPNPGSTARDMATNHDHAFFDRPGKESLGDIDITNDNRYLFGVNMFDKTVFVFDLADDSYVGSYAIPNPGCGDDWRPMGTGVGLDVSYVGGVCSGQTNQDMDEMTAHVYTFDPADGTFGAQVLDQPLTYSKGQAYDGGNCNGGIEGSAIGRWFSWVSRFPSVPNEQRAAGCSTGWMAYPTPMLGDIIEETNGDLVISFRDRFTDQAGWNALEETATGTFSTLYQPAAGGDIVRGCKLSDGTFVLDPNLDAGDVLAPSALCTNNNDGSTNNGGQSTTFREFYTGDWRTGFHEEAFYGGIALARSEVNLTGTGYDMNGAVWTQGIGAINRNGSLTSGNLGVQTDDSTVGLFGKGTGMADLEVLCDEAPIQVGNRVWMDTDGDGIQDPGEIPIVGVTVRLYDELGNLVGTTTTSANGEYYFDQTNVTGGLSQDTTYVVRLDLPTDYEAGGPLYSTQPTLANVGANDELDSDGVVVDGYPQATLTTGGAGVDDHTWDFGFTLPSVSVGDFVWVDTSRDGIQDPGEPGIPGVVLILTDADGQPVTDVYGNLVGPVTTDADGLYDFPGLPVGAAYTVTIDEAASAAALAPYIPTIPGAGDPDEDSSTGSATSVVLPNDGDRDPTLDFGFVLPAVSVGDYVWVDTDRDGIQDPGEPGIPGVTLTLTGPDGEPVTDVFGNPVEPAVTDGDGFYDFVDLPALPPGESYTVTVTPPDGYIPTIPGAGDPDEDSSTGSATSGDLVNDGDRDDTLDFGFVLGSVSVGDYVWVDTDRDGIQDPGEPGIPGVTLTLTGPDGEPVTDVFGNPVEPVITDGSGFYVFPDLPTLPAGESYTVTIDPTSPALDPYIPTIPGQGDPDEDSSTGSATSGDLVNDGDSDMTLDFGFVVPSVSVGDYVWVDTDRDGIQDPGEPGIPGVVLILTGPDGEPVTDVFGNPVGPATTDGDGLYDFPNLPGGVAYTVTIDPVASAGALAPYVPTIPGAGDPDEDSSTGSATSVVLPNDGDRDDTLDFGFVLPSVSVGDYVWVDTDRDGIQDPGEPGIPGVTLTLTGPDGEPVTDVFGNPVEPAVTDSDGFYDFPNLPALPAGESYTVTIDPTSPALDPYIPTIPGQGDPDEDSSTGSATSGDLVNDGDRDDTLDFGFVLPSVSVGDYVWVDTDRDGIQDPGEPGIPGVTLTLTGPDGEPVTDVFGNPVEPVITDGDGFYDFPNLPALPAGQSYTVTIDPTSPALAPYIPTTPGQGDPDEDSSTGSATSGDLVNDGDRDDTLDFGFVLPSVSVGNFVWVDTDRDGIQDPGEPGIPGVVLILTGPDGEPVTDVFGNPVGPATTDANGRYNFPNLPGGVAYTVTIDPVASAGALAPYIPTTPGAGNNPAVDSSTGSATSVVLPNDGDRDSTLDFGFVLPSVSVGDYVWLDTDRDGVQDGNEPGIGGVQLTLTGPGGQPVTDVFGNPVPPVRTGPDGSYLFANLPALPPGQHYTVTVTSPPTDQVRIEGAAAPIAFGTIAPTTPNAGGNPARDSSTGSATSGNLTVNGAHDPTLDFGFVVSSVSVGGNLWEDADGDGTIDPGEPPIGGVLLELTGPDGEPVTDVFGNPVPPVRTDPDGRYDFANLPVLPPGSSYTVSIVRTDPQTTSALNGMNLTTTSWQLPADGLTDHGDVADGLDFGFRPPVAPQPPAPTTTTPPPLAPGLPATGGDIAQTLSFTMLLLMLGTGLTVLARQRRRVT